MEFTAAQIEKLQNGLHAYRVLSAVNGRRPPWKTVLNKIERLRIDARDPSRTTVSPFAPEALRRFAKRISIPDDANRLGDIKRLLVAASVLSENDFAEDTSLRTEALSVHASLANTTSDARWRLEQLARVYKAKSNSDFGDGYVEIRLRREPQLTWFEVEEFNYLRSPMGPPDQTDRFASLIPVQRFVRKGYGFVSTSERMLCIFVKGAYQDDRIHYFEVWPGIEWSKGDIFLSAVGQQHQPRRPGDEVEMQMLKTLNVLQFAVQHVSEEDVETEE